MAWWWGRVAFAVKRALASVAARAKSGKQGSGLTKLRNDVQTCGYEDVKVMWEMLRRSEAEFETSTMMRRKRPCRRVLVIASSHRHIRHHQPPEAAKLGLA